MNAHQSRLSHVLPILFLLSTTPAFSLPPDEYLEENPDFESLLSDLPPGFDFSTASEAELRLIPFLDSNDIESILLLRGSLGEYPERSDFYGVTEKLSPLVRFLLENPGDAAGTKRKADTLEIRGGLDIHRGESVDTGRQYLKITAGSVEKVRLSIVGERDPFEPRAADLASLGLSFPVERLKSRVVLGDFRPGFGMGLLFARYPTYFQEDRLRYHSSAIPLNTSFDETRFMRGGMVITRKGRFESRLWTSRRHLDATMEEGKAIGLDESGLHLSGSDRGNLNERIDGAYFSFGGEGSEISVTGALSHYSPGFSRPEGERYFGRPEAASFPQVSLAGRTRRGPAEFAFEHARMRGGEYATLGGITLEKGRTDTGVLLRDYSPGCWAPRSGAPSAFGSVSNERGIHSFLNTTLPTSLYLTVSLDLAKMKGRSWSRPMPVSRRQFFLSLRKRIHPRMEGSVSCRTADDTESNGRRWSVRGRLERPSGMGWGWRGSAAWSEGKGKGGPFMEAAVTGRRKGASFTGTVGGFRIPSYFSRYYQYMPDVPGRGGTAGVWGNGYSASVVCTIGRLSGRVRVTDSDLMPLQREITLQTDLSF